MAIATLTIDIVAKLANLQTGMDRAAQIAERNSKRIEDAFKTAGTALKTAFAGIGVQQLVQAFNQTAEGLAKFKDVAEASGVAIEELSKLEPVARSAGLTIDDVGSLSLKLSKALSGVDDESRGAGKALAQIGISLKEFRALDAAEQMQTLARALNRFADDGNKAAIGQAILGKEWSKASAYLKELAEAGELNATVTKEQVEAADQYTKNLARLQQNVSGLARALVSELAPAVNNAFDRFRQVDFGRVLGAGPLPGMMLREYGRQLDEINRRELERANALRNSAGAYDEVERLLRRAPPPSVGVFTAAEEGAKKAATAVRDLTKELNSYSESLARERGDLANWLGLREIREAEESFRAVQTRIERINDLTGRSAANKLASDLALIDDAFFAGKISVEEYENALRKVSGITDEVTKSTEKTRSIAEELGLTFSSAFEDAIVRGEDLRDVLRGLEQDIIRIVTRKLVTEPIGNSISGFFGSAMGSAGSTAAGSGAFFDAFADAFIKIFGMASGGPVVGGYPYMVGEKGPELFVPESSGQIMPNGARMGSTVININVPANTSGATAQQIAATVARQLSLADARLN